jgi:hypothetical protein
MKVAGSYLLPAIGPAVSPAGSCPMALLQRITDIRVRRKEKHLFIGAELGLHKVSII